MDLTPLYVRSEYDTVRKLARVQYADERGNYWLAKASEHEERGNSEQAKHCFDKGQRWLDRMNKLANALRPA